MLRMAQSGHWPRVVIVGGGFAGIHAAKTLAKAPVKLTLIDRRVRLAFELAERESIAQGKRRDLNFVVIGAGPTGVELAGAISDISRRYMEQEFRGIDPRQARVILLEGGPRVLPNFPEDLS